MNPKKKTSEATIGKIKKLRQVLKTADVWVDEITNGDKNALSQAITLLESTKPEHQLLANDIIEGCLPASGNSIRIGITGVPGVGKSTFIEVFGSLLTGQGKKVAVLAVDPSSTISKGSILGDKTRMEKLSVDENAFIRPSPAGSSLGGVARATKETIVLCEAAGFDVLLVETVGVGQSETAVNNMVDFFLLLKLSGAGDELQGIKRGIMEMADAIAINKADGQNQKRAALAQTEFTNALHLYPPKNNGWSPKVLLCSALAQTGIAEIWSVIMDFKAKTQVNGSFYLHRKQQDQQWFTETFFDLLQRSLEHQPEFLARKNELQEKINENKISPFAAALALMQKISER
ncbi:MAG: methylmalonyl Co-A mutase-associated GTPase MeaB [Bacteroidota bacterium]